MHTRRDDEDHDSQASKCIRDDLVWRYAADVAEQGGCHQGQADRDGKECEEVAGRVIISNLRWRKKMMVRKYG